MPTTTPAVWKDTFSPVADTDSTQEGIKTIALSNGNILSVWVDANDTTASGTGSDVVGQIFSPLGNPVGDPIYLNEDFGANLDVFSVDVAAKDDGGFSIVYEFVNSSDNDDNGIIFMSFDAAGESDPAFNNNIAREMLDNAFNYRNPQIVHRPDGSAVVVYEEDNNGALSIEAVIVNADGTMSGPDLVRAGGGDPIDPEIALLANGDVVIAIEENDGADSDLEIWRLSDGNISFDDDSVMDNGVDDVDPDIAALQSGGYVVTWERGGDIYGRIYDDTGTPTGVEVALVDTTESTNEPQVIGLPDGGFFLVWDNDSALAVEGRRFDSAGAPVGGVITISDQDGFQPHVSLTTDGRILVSFENLIDGGVYLDILDPRDEEISVTDGSVTTASIAGSKITGSSAEDLFYGMDGDDTLKAKGGDDAIYGGGGDDKLRGGSGDDTMKGGKGDDHIKGSSGNDTAKGGTGDDTFNGGSGNDTFKGGNGDDIAKGKKGNDDLSGGKGKDDLYGNSGKDELNGNKGADVIIGGRGQDDMTGGKGNDVFVFTTIKDSKVGSSKRDVIEDFKHNKDKIDLSLIDANKTAGNGGDQAFEFIGTAAFSAAGQLRAVEKGNKIVLSGDRNGDGDADFQIELTGPATIDTFDFIL